MQLLQNVVALAYSWTEFKGWLSYRPKYCLVLYDNVMPGLQNITIGMFVRFKNHS